MPQHHDLARGHAALGPGLGHRRAPGRQGTQGGRRQQAGIPLGPRLPEAPVEQGHQPIEARLGEKAAPTDERNGQALVEKRRGIGPFGRNAEHEGASIPRAALPENLLAIRKHRRGLIELLPTHPQKGRGLSGRHTFGALGGQGQTCPFQQRHIAQGQTGSRQKSIETLNEEETLRGRHHGQAAPSSDGEGGSPAGAHDAAPVSRAHGRHKPSTWERAGARSPQRRQGAMGWR